MEKWHFFVENLLITLWKAIFGTLFEGKNFPLFALWKAVENYDFSTSQ
ncbi:MAG: hypothetical protein RMJ97_10345 [Raineya sp.]|nr:hypothetical protein [Raineya sp.]MDW8297266.1 hypothetical protein [Raineya sp.]